MTIGRSNTVLDFVISRAARLYPAFWVCALVTTVIAIMVPASAQQITIGQAVVNATMLNLYFGVESIEPVYWSLAFEIGFYALIAAVFASGLIRRIEVVGCAWVAASFILLKLFPALGEDIPWRLQAAVSLPYASLFFAGIIF